MIQGASLLIKPGSLICAGDDPLDLEQLDRKSTRPAVGVDFRTERKFPAPGVVIDGEP